MPQPQPLVRIIQSRVSGRCFVSVIKPTGLMVRLKVWSQGRMEGAKLLYELMQHYTQRKFVYVHEWDEGDLILRQQNHHSLGDMV